jgi:hypothetical protein
MAAASELPPFPSDIVTHPLLVLDYQLLKAGDEAEIDRLWQGSPPPRGGSLFSPLPLLSSLTLCWLLKTAATTLGFWYLKNHEVDADAMFDLAERTLALPLGEKKKFDQGPCAPPPGEFV